VKNSDGSESGQSCHLIEEGSENKNKENSDQGRDLKEDDLEEEEEECTQVGPPNIFVGTTLTEPFHVQFSS